LGLEVGPLVAVVCAVGRDLGGAGVGDAEAFGESLELAVVAGEPVALVGVAVDEVPAGEGGEGVGDGGAREAGAGLDGRGGGAMAVLDGFVGEGCGGAELFKGGAESVGLPSDPADGLSGGGVAVGDAESVRRGLASTCAGGERDPGVSLGGELAKEYGNGLET